MSLYETCPQCEELHDILALEPSFRMPDAYLVVPADERDQRTLASKDACAVRDLHDMERRYFLRVLAPFSIEGLEEPISWGVWVEVTESQFERVQQLWDDPNQSDEPPFRATIANDLLLYNDSLSITGLVSLSDPQNIPTFHATTPPDHPFVREQQTKVPSSRVAEWLVPVYHPEWITQREITKRSRLAPGQDLSAPSEAALRKKRPWWNFW